MDLKPSDAARPAQPFLIFLHDAKIQPRPNADLGNDRTFCQLQIRAIHPDSLYPPIVEERKTPAEAASRGSALFRLGYTVEITPRLPPVFVLEAKIKDAYGVEGDVPLPAGAEAP